MENGIIESSANREVIFTYCLRQLFLWRKAGGALFHEQVEKEKKEEFERLRVAQMKRDASSPNPYSFSCSFTSSEKSFLDVTSKVLNKLMGF